MLLFCFYGNKDNIKSKLNLLTKLGIQFYIYRNKIPTLATFLPTLATIVVQPAKPHFLCPRNPGATAAGKF